MGFTRCCSQALDEFGAIFWVRSVLCYFMSGVGVTKVHSLNESGPRSRISNLINHPTKNQ